jgi:aspartate/methionine/tyrosine aminotransferase
VTHPLILLKLLIHSGLSPLLPGLQRRLGGGAEYLRYYSNRLLSSPAWELECAVNALQPPGPDVLDLTAGSPQFDLLPSAGTKLPADRRGWPPFPGLPELRSAVSERLRAHQGLAFNPNTEVLITSGVHGAVATVMDAFVNRGDRVVLLDPTSPLYVLAARTRRARVCWLPTWVEEGRTRFRLDQLARALRGARLFMLSSPANPTGGVIATEDLEQIAWWADRHDVLILSDEIFERYQYESPSPAIGTLARARPRTLTTGGVSKGHALTSARVGWLAGYRHLLRPCLITAALHSPFVPTLSQQIALAALRTPEESFEPLRAEFAARRRYVYERLRAIDLKPEWPAGGLSVWVPVWELGRSGRQFAEGLLRDKNVRILPGDLFGPSGAGYFRLSYAVDDGRLQEGLNRLTEYVQGRTAPRARLAA